MLSVLKMYFQFGSAYRDRLYKGLLFTILCCLFEGLQITALWIVFSALTAGTLSGQTALLALGVMGISIAGTFVCSHFKSENFCDANFSMAGKKRAEVGDTLRHLPMGYFNENSLGEVTSIMTNQLDAMQNLGGLLYMTIVGGLVFSLIVVIFLCALDWRLGLMAAVTLALFCLSMELLQSYVRVTAEKFSAANTALVSAVLEYVRGISVVRAFSLVDDAEGKLAHTVDDCRAQALALEFKALRFSILQMVVSKATSVVMCLMSVWLWLSGSLATATCLTVVVVSFMLFSRLEAAGRFSAILRNIEIAMEQTNELLATPPMDEGAAIEKADAFDIEVSDITFGYDDRRILDGVSLSIPAGTSCAIVGPSGSGKTTLARLIERFWDVDSGKVTLGGHDVRDYKVDSLLQNFSTVFQGVFLFDDTIENNIKFGSPEATHEQVVEAARRACCEEFIQALPNGYETRLGESGSSLSGGERQRLSIARAILKDAPIVVLDEATANVDPENELELQRAIAELTQSKTVIMIAHRLKTVRNADQILVLDHGHIVQRGTHESLMAEGGLYADFVNMREKTVGWKIA
ncbi:ABC transporter ATP-binding protein [Atopobium sp. oral taxon 199]|uniref:ABC transporter ATP-binding protein n=1 Tax=Atopobium sp. oral taxon 199 TaxID=712156 RepID=UPI00034E7C5A|nr:ABC transporter ATP-binding protein [Atopobium sp. oral taxon 199]EPD77365.1 ATP-binding cassette, subfamily B, bacterial [Atopobium sp. oral taxon 199 str. F0494]